MIRMHKKIEKRGWTFQTFNLVLCFIGQRNGALRGQVALA